MCIRDRVVKVQQLYTEITDQPYDLLRPTFSETGKMPLIVAQLVPVTDRTICDHHYGFNVLPV